MTEVIVGIIDCRDAKGQKQFLLISSKQDFNEFTGKYYPPGGHLEPGEDKITALKRELKEELGIEIEPNFEIAQTPGDIQNQITYWWHCNWKDQPLVIQQEEIADAKWFSETEIINSDQLWPATKKFFTEYLSKSED